MHVYILSYHGRLLTLRGRETGRQYILISPLENIIMAIRKQEQIPEGTSVRRIHISEIPITVYDYVEVCTAVVDGKIITSKLAQYLVVH